MSIKNVTFLKKLGINSINQKKHKLMKNLIVILIAVIGISSLTSCSTSEKCWAYSDVKKVQLKHSKNSVGYNKKYRPSARRGGHSMGCYSFN